MVYMTKTPIGSPVEANGPRDLTFKIDKGQWSLVHVTWPFGIV